MGLSGIILAFVSRGELVYGHIYDPYTNEEWTAVKGEGAYLNGKPIKVCKTAKLETSVLVTGSPPNISALNACLRALNLISSKVRTMRMLGSAALHTAWIANGRLTGYFEAGNTLMIINCSYLIHCHILRFECVGHCGWSINRSRSWWKSMLSKP
jgi:fructose-1,6-bisphosphatase/inositol monophosphatase family enzyme